MKNPPHPGRGLRCDIEALGLTVAKAADGLGVSRQQLALRLEQGVGGTADGWLALQTTYDLARARALGTIKVSMSLSMLAQVG